MFLNVLVRERFLANNFMHECIVGECPAFSVGTNVKCSPSCKGITVGNTITFSCNPGYAMAGNQKNSVAHCGDDRTWNTSSAPVCKGEPVYYFVHYHYL